MCCCKDTMEIPNANSFVRFRKKGFLLKLTGKGWLYSGSWKKRFCVLDGSKFYYYENEKSKGSEKSSGVISLDYYDVCEEYDAKDKKNPHVFIIGTSVRGFFDNRHQFAADSKLDMQDWIRSVHDVINEARNVRSRVGRNRIDSGNSDDQMGDELENPDLNIEESGQLVNATKDRVRGPQGRRLPQRKSMMPAGTPTEDGIQKQRSFSLSSPKEQENEDASDISPSDGKRISLSMDAVDRDDQMEDESMNGPRSSSSYEISSKRLAEDSKRTESNKSAKKAVFGKLGGQHAALTKELELKLKSGLAPGGRRLQMPEPTEDEDEENASKQDIRDLNKKMHQLDTDLSVIRTNFESLERRVEELASSSNANNEVTRSIMSQIHDVIGQAATALKDAQETNSECERVLEEVRQAKDDHQKLLQECREILTVFKAIPLPPLTEETEKET